jgi:hypothetical protein
MSRLETIDGTSWEALLASPVAVLVLAKTSCPACGAWSEELGTFLEDDARWSGVRFGKVYLDVGGLASFKRVSPWLSEVEDLPYNVLYVKGEKVKAWPGGGIARLVARLEDLAAQ